MLSLAIDTVLERAFHTIGAGIVALREALDRIPVAIYVTDVAGVIAYFSPACIEFTGRRPEVEKDRWESLGAIIRTWASCCPITNIPWVVPINTRWPVRGVGDP